jgi:hypothetical protein
MNILYLQQHIQEQEILKDHYDLIQSILSGALRSPQVKKLVGINYQGESVYRAKINNKDRLIYTYIVYKNQRTLLVLASNDHNYNKLLRQLGAPNPRFEDLELIEPAPEDERSPALDGNEGGRLSLLPAVGFHQKTLVLDHHQQEGFIKGTPLLLSGPPGAGKTVVLYNMMVRALQDYALQVSQSPFLEQTNLPLLFLSPSQNLINSLQNNTEHQAIKDAPSVEFTTWQSLLASHYPDCTPVDDEEFARWLHKQMPKEPADTLRYEFSLIMALGFKEYEKLGKRQCYYVEQTNKRKKLPSLLQQWLDHLAQKKKFDPIVSIIPPNPELKYLSVFCDEAQNLPPTALLFLIESAKNQQFIACLDSEQCLLLSPYILSCLKKLLHQVYGHFNHHHLPRTWRNPRKIAEVGNHVMRAKYQFDGKGKRREYSYLESARDEEGLISFIDQNAFSTIQELTAQASTVVIVDESLYTREREKIKNQLKTAHIMTAKEAIGLDFEVVILWKPSNTPCFKKISTATGLTLNQLTAMNGLYVALSRSQSTVFIYENEPHSRQIAETFFGRLPLNQLDNTQIPVSRAEVQQEWQERARCYLKEGKETLAREIMSHHLNLTEQAIEEEIALFKPIDPNRQASSVAKERISLPHHPIKKAKSQSAEKNAVDLTKQETNKTQRGKQRAKPQQTVRANTNRIQSKTTRLAETKTAGSPPKAPDLQQLISTPEGQHLVKTLLDINPSIALTISAKTLCENPPLSAGKKFNISPLFSLTSSTVGRSILSILLKNNANLAKGITAEAFCLPLPPSAGKLSHTSPLFELASTAEGGDILYTLLKENRHLAQTISAEALCLSRLEGELLHTSPLYWLTTSPKGIAILSLLLKENPNFAKNITGKALSLALPQSAVELVSFNGG